MECTYMYIYTRDIRIPIYIYEYTLIRASTYTNMRILTYARIYTCMFVYVCTCAHVYILIYIYINAYFLIAHMRILIY